MFVINMERYEKMLEISSSVTRVRLIKLLMQRPRCLSELSDMLSITPQAVMKHLAILKKNGLVDFVIPEKSIGLVRKVYRLLTPVQISLDSEGGVDYFQAFKEEDLVKHEVNVPKERFYDVLQRLEDEKFDLERRLKSIRNKEIRIIKELLNLEVLERQMIRIASNTAFEEILFYTSLSPEFEKELDNLSKYFGLSIDVAKKAIKNLLEKSKK